MIEKIIKTITPLSNADTQSIITAFKHYFLYLHWENGTLCFWNGTHFVSPYLSKEEQSKFIRKVLQRLLDEKFIESSAGEKILTELIYNCDCPSIERKEGARYLNLQNGVLIIYDNGEVEFDDEHHPKYGMKYILPYSYNEKAIAKRFKRFLRETIEEAEATMVLVEYFGYIMLNRKFSLEKVLFLIGGGSNGKSVLINVIKKLFGAYNVSDVELHKLANENAAILIEGKWVNIGSDASSKKLDSSLFKKIASAEPVQGKKLYQDIRMMTDLPRQLFATNGMPDNDDTSHGFFRRLIIIEFNNTFTKNSSKPNIEEELEAELSGILNLAIEGMWRLLEQGNFTESEKIDSALLAYKNDLNAVKRFIDEYEITYDLESRTKSETLYQYYTEWAKNEGLRPSSKQELVRELKKHGFIEYRNDNIKGFKVTTNRSLFEENSTKYSLPKRQARTGILTSKRRNSEDIESHIEESEYAPSYDIHGHLPWDDD